MQWFTSALLSLLIAPVQSFSTTSGSHNKRAVAATHATWLWHSENIQDSTSVAELLSFSSSHNISRMYAQVNSDIPIDTWSSFIQQCTTAGIAVEALFGNSQWILDSGRPTLDDTLTWIKSYQTSAADSAKFVGLHMDVEPWTLPDYESETSTYLTSWQNIITKVSSFASSLSLPLASDVPFWLNTLNSPTTSQTMDVWVLEHLDGATFMTYRNSASELINIATTPMEAAQAAGTNVWVAVETTDLGAADNKAQSYYGKSEVILEQDLETVRAWAAQYSVFQGVAVHDAQGWAAMA